MEHIVSLLYRVFGTVLFCMALTFCFLGFDLLDNMLKMALNSQDYGAIGSSQASYYEPIITRSDIVGLFLTGLEQNIVIYGTLYEKESGHAYLLEEIRLPSTFYRKDCIYSEDTTLKQIVFIPLE